MQANSYSPYALKDLHQAIDLMDRKIAWCSSGEIFASEEAREDQLRKLSTKRAALVKSALALANLGVRCDPKFLARSMAEARQEEGTSAAAQAATDEGTGATKPARSRRRKS